MACAVPVIGSHVCANIDVINNECGLLATTPNDWIAGLRMLRDQPTKRTEMGQAGHERVDKYYSLHRNLPLLEAVIREVAAKA
jgi:glycosyltransferase involved in cell wall biosynthesis